MSIVSAPRYREWHGDDRLSSPVSGERNGRQRLRGVMSAMPASLHRRRGLSDDRLPGSFSGPASRLPDLHWKQPLLSLQADAERLTAKAAEPRFSLGPNQIH